MKNIYTAVAVLFNDEDGMLAKGNEKQYLQRKNKTQ